MNQTTQSVKAEVCHTHYGHQTRLGHIRLGAQDRLQIAGKLAQGVTLDKILDDERSSVSDNFKRIHIIQRKDTNNMERAFKLEGGQRHHDDATSVAAWVEEMRRMGDDNVVLYYKPQGADDNKQDCKEKTFSLSCRPLSMLKCSRTSQRSKLSVLLQHMALMHMTLSWSHC